MKQSFSRLISLMRKEFIQILRDPRTFALVLIVPILQILLMGYAATNDVRNVPLAVFDQDHGASARSLLDAYRAADYFSIRFMVTSEDELRRLIENGQARAGLIIPPNYSAKVDNNGSAAVMMVIDGSDPTVATNSLAAARLIAQQHATQIQQERLTALGQSAALRLPLEMQTQIWYNPDMSSAYFMIPGVIAMILFAIASILTSTAVVRERERGTIEQLIVTPIKPWELIVGKLTPYTLLAFANTLEVLTLGSLLFHVPIRGDLGLILLLSGLFLLTGLGMGLFISTIANSQQEAFLLAFMTMLPSIFLSGFFFPIQAMPKILQWISYLVPMRYYLVVIRALLLKGSGFAAVQNDVLAMAIFSVGIMTLAVLRVRKRLD